MKRRVSARLFSKNQTMKLTEHFKLEEFTRSETAARKGLDNTPNKTQIAALKQLCKKVLEPYRDLVEKPVIISSGYRCPELNKLVGGAKNSQHMKGEAADLHMNSYKDAKRCAVWLLNNTDFDQILIETSNHRTYWVHVSCKLNAAENRHVYSGFLFKE